MANFDSEPEIQTLVHRNLMAQAKASVAPAPVGVAYTLTVLDGPDVGAALTLREGHEGAVAVGTHATCEMRLTDRLVSRRHLTLRMRGELLQLVDEDSTNGTSVNGLRIRDVMLRGHEILRIGRTTLRVEVKRARDPVGVTATGFGRVVGASAAMQRIYPLCARIARSDVPCLIEGETGTGKEVLAESLHAASARSGAPFVVFDCTTVPSNLIESVLFGHERGAFTGAVGPRRGVFEQAHGGTLFIDEIGDLDPALQPKLLRAVQRGEIQRVGGERWMSVDVRVIAATRRNLEKEIEAGRFRDDLFYRLAVTRVALPPLRDRDADIQTLAAHFWAKLGGTPETFPHELLHGTGAGAEGYGWPGNVRELENTVARRFALGDLAEPGPVTVASVRGRDVMATWPEMSPPPTLPAPAAAVVEGSPDDLVDDDEDAPPSGVAPTEDFLQRTLERGLPFPEARNAVLEEFKRRYVSHVLSRHGGNVGAAAAASGIARRYFQLIRARSRG